MNFGFLEKRMYTGGLVGEEVDGLLVLGVHVAGYSS